MRSIVQRCGQDEMLKGKLFCACPLLPVMHQQSLPRKLLDLKSWARTMVVEFRQALNNILLLKSNEIAFIEAVRKEGKIIPELITDNAELAQKIALHHLLNLTPI